MRDGDAPAAARRVRRDRARIVAVGAAFESMKKRQPAKSGAMTGKIDVDEVAVGRFPALALELDARRRPERRVDRLQVAARQPPGRRIGIRGQGRNSFLRYVKTEL